MLIQNLHEDSMCEQRGGVIGSSNDDDSDVNRNGDSEDPEDTRTSDGDRSDDFRKSESDDYNDERQQKAGHGHRRDSKRKRSTSPKGATPALSVSCTGRVRRPNVRLTYHQP